MQIEFNDIDNDAFKKGYRVTEVINILKGIERKVFNGDTSGLITDFNGNTIGSWSMEKVGA